MHHGESLGSYCVNDIKLPWNNVLGLTTDKVPAYISPMCGEKGGLVGRMEKHSGDRMIISWCR